MGERRGGKIRSKERNCHPKSHFYALQIFILVICIIAAVCLKTTPHYVYVIKIVTDKTLIKKRYPKSPIPAVNITTPPPSLPSPSIFRATIRRFSRNLDVREAGLRKICNRRKPIAVSLHGRFSKRESGRRQFQNYYALVGNVRINLIQFIL